VNFIPRGQISPLGAKFIPRGEIRPWGLGVKLRMALRFAKKRPSREMFKKQLSLTAYDFPLFEKDCGHLKTKKTRQSF
jgi:hypothetical protein